MTCHVIVQNALRDAVAVVPQGTVRGGGEAIKTLICEIMWEIEGPISLYVGSLIKPTHVFSRQFILQCDHIFVECKKIERNE